MLGSGCMCTLSIFSNASCWIRCVCKWPWSSHLSNSWQYVCISGLMRSEVWVSSINKERCPHRDKSPSLPILIAPVFVPSSIHPPPLSRGLFPSLFLSTLEPSTPTIIFLDPAPVTSMSPAMASCKFSHCACSSLGASPSGALRSASAVLSY